MKRILVTIGLCGIAIFHALAQDLHAGTNSTARPEYARPSPPGYSEAAVKQMARRIDERILEQKRRGGATREEMLSAIEDQQISRGERTRPTDWTSWANLFSLRRIEEPVSFDIRDAPESLQLTDPVKATRVYLHLKHTSDKRVLQMVDETRRKELASIETGRYRPLGSYATFTNSTKITVVATATTEQFGHQYALCFYRREHPADPTESHFQIGTAYFKKTERGWVATGDMVFTQFGMWTLHGLRSGGKRLGEYEMVKDSLLQCPLPKYFYLSDESPEDSANAPLQSPTEEDADSR